MRPHKEGRSDREVLEAPHGECRKSFKHKPTNTGKPRRYSTISIAYSYFIDKLLADRDSVEKRWIAYSFVCE
jgi:hypothetical protein